MYSSKIENFSQFYMVILRADMVYLEQSIIRAWWSLKVESNSSL